MGSAAADSHSVLRSTLLKLVDRERLRSALASVGFDATLVPIAAYRQCREWLNAIGVETMDVLEIAPGHYWEKLPFRSYKAVDFPAFDICKDVLAEEFDLIIADQVLSMFAPRGLPHEMRGPCCVREATSFASCPFSEGARLS